MEIQTEKYKNRYSIVDTILSSLNESQRAAVEYVGGPELVIAGAGSGKTRVLTYKIAYLLSIGVKPWNVLTLTFTNKAAREMKERIGKLVGEDAARYLNMGTFHSVFLRILRSDSEAIGLKCNFTIYDDSDSRTLLTSIIKELQLDDKTYKAASVLSRIGMAKNNLISPERYLSDGSLAERDIRSNMPKVGELYRRYVQRCRMANALDFDDMLFYTYLLFSNHPEICNKYAERFKYVLVDEYQDTNYAQQCIVTLLTRENQNICAVGDDAQSIYAFRGANIDNILNFENIYRGAKLFKLERNYRSTQNIVEAANCLICHNSRQIRKKVYSENPEGEKIKVNIAYSDKEEAGLVGDAIRRLHSREKVEYSDMAILYRTNAQSRLFEDELRREGIPYRIYGGMSFYQRKEIKDIIAYFRLVANPDDDEAFKRIVNYPKRGIGASTVDKIITASRKNAINLWSVADNPTFYQMGISASAAKKVVMFHDLIQSFVDLSRSLDVYELGKRIMEETGMSKEIFADTSEDGLERKENVEEFISSLHDYVDTKREEDYGDEVYIDNFLQEVALVTDADKDNGADDSGDTFANDKVSLMTIHASKGLEFNTVFVVGVEENIFPSPRACDFPKDLEEERRLFYVAITRAEKHCIISCAKSRYQYGNMMFNEPSRFLHEIDSKLLDINGKLTTSRANYENEIFGNSNNRISSERVVMPKQTMQIPSRYRKVSQSPSSVTHPINDNSHGKASNSGLSVGTKIEHMRFGVGIVTKLEGNGENEKATVEFENVGIKTLLLKFAKFKVVV